MAAAAEAAAAARLEHLHGYNAVRAEVLAEAVTHGFQLGDLVGLAWLYAIVLALDQVGRLLGRTEMLHAACMACGCGGTRRLLPALTRRALRRCAACPAAAAAGGHD